MVHTEAILVTKASINLRRQSHFQDTIQSWLRVSRLGGAKHSSFASIESLFHFGSEGDEIRQNSDLERIGNAGKRPLYVSGEVESCSCSKEVWHRASFRGIDWLEGRVFSDLQVYIFPAVSLAPV